MEYRNALYLGYTKKPLRQFSYCSVRLPTRLAVLVTDKLLPQFFASYTVFLLLIGRIQDFAIYSPWVMAL